MTLTAVLEIRNIAVLSICRQGLLLDASVAALLLLCADLSVEMKPCPAVGFSWHMQADRCLLRLSLPLKGAGDIAATMAMFCYCCCCCCRCFLLLPSLLLSGVATIHHHEHGNFELPAPLFQKVAAALCSLLSLFSLFLLQGGAPASCLAPAFPLLLLLLLLLDAAAPAVRRVPINRHTTSLRQRTSVLYHAVEHETQ